MSTQWAKGYWKELDPDEQIEAALRDGLSEDRSGIDSNPASLRPPGDLPVQEAEVSSREIRPSFWTLRNVNRRFL
jgi:hypothetical protein